MVFKGAKEVVPISMIQGRKRNSINGELVIDPTDPSYREEVLQLPQLIFIITIIR